MPKYRVENHTTGERFTVYGYQEVDEYFAEHTEDSIDAYREEKVDERKLVASLNPS